MYNIIGYKVLVDCLYYRDFGRILEKMYLKIIFPIEESENFLRIFLRRIQRGRHEWNLFRRLAKKLAPLGVGKTRVSVSCSF